MIGLREKSHTCLRNNNDEDEKGKVTKKCDIKRKLKFEDCKNCLEAGKIGRKMNYLEKKKKIDVDSLKKYPK